MLCYCLLLLALIPLDDFLRAGRSWQCCLLMNISCEGPFSEIFYSWNGYNLEPSSVYHFHCVPSLCFLLFISLKIRFLKNVLSKHIIDHSISSSSLNCRQGIYLENLIYNMISMYLLALIRIPNAMTRQQEQNMIDLYKHVLPPWQINEKEDIVKLTCVFWTRYELHIISKLLLTTNVLIPEESKEIKQRQWSENLAKEAIIGLNANKH